MFLNLFMAASGAVSGAAPVVSNDLPNIIVFLVDDMGLMDTSVPFITDNYGNPVSQPLNSWYHTPNMERLARQGVRFSTFYAQSVSSPSRASLLTGQNATRHRTTNWINAESNNRTPYGPFEWNWKGIGQEDMILPRVLQQIGYKTIHVGKAHFGSNGSEAENPLNVGFDVNIGGSAIGHPGSYYGQSGYGRLKGDKSRAVPHLEAYHGQDIFLSDALTLEANKEMEKAVSEKRPFYLNMAHYAVHAPFEADERFLSRYTDPDKSTRAKAFATLIEGMDKSLGDMMDTLEKLGVAGNTLILFLGDNGGDAPLGNERGYGSSAPLRGKKGSEFEGGMRVPFIASWAKPERANKNQKRFPIAAGQVQTQLGTIMDIYPTVLSLVGCAMPSNHVVDGFNLKTLLAGKKDKKHSGKFLMHFPHEHRGSYFTVYREDAWKLIYYYNPAHPDQPGHLLYRLDDDPTESNDLSLTYPDKVKEMKQKMIRQLDAERALYPVDKDGKTLRPVL